MTLRVTNVDLLKRIGMYKEDTDFNRRAAAYADGARKLARATKHREKTNPQLNEERLSRDRRQHRDR